jgi:hypothetical protein
MTTPQAIGAGVILALAPSFLIHTYLLWLDGKLPPHQEDHQDSNARRRF